ncbi:hypothetical protein GUJ93_ZPchr0007g3041 [Zizania palustris]|uniref:Uncharacterized protein n=1 Tax=Zizania palustris TaxID=103762 RepID=A0A8J5T645_ZIZPA|nr:hypothetical protein GUJ93_ZPchr0007g3041 [Zizania palustris]
MIALLASSRPLPLARSLASSPLLDEAPQNPSIDGGRRSVALLLRVPFRSVPGDSRSRGDELQGRRTGSGAPAARARWCTPKGPIYDSMVERPIIYDVRARPNLVESTSGSMDLQMFALCVSGSVLGASHPSLGHPGQLEASWAIGGWRCSDKAHLPGA